MGNEDVIIDYRHLGVSKKSEKFIANYLEFVSFFEQIRSQKLDCE